MRITVIGGGNIGTLMAADAAYKGNEVVIYTSKPEQWNKELRVYDADDKLLRRGHISKVTNSMREAVEKAEHIWITMPPHLFSSIAEEILPFVHEGQKIGIIPGSGGGEFAFRKVIEKDVILFGLQRVHSIARLKKYGESVYELGRKNSIKIGSIPSHFAINICKEMESVFDIPGEWVSNYLSVTLTPSNPILHTTRLYSIFKDYDSKSTYPRNILFYEEWTNDSSDLLMNCDCELQNICRIIPLDLTAVVSLKDYYESHTVDEMTQKIRGIKAFKGLFSPMKQTGTGWIPDWNSRYFVSDFSFGIKVIKEIAKIFLVHTPNIDMVWNWYQRNTMSSVTEVFELDLDRKEFINLYK
ncbi:MAG: NAD(P)-binding domain-containing protein [Lachnospiraceae bacterium]|jgi:opine dehydrogenase|nr:NAD/NADP-dependent octopine/nopaline dehydrogenase family protein [uncultured Acetatifactor sp.]MCI9218555.1 NAD(P)-binding domain-containing protein [Lachnospiraceae bacterium]